MEKDHHFARQALKMAQCRQKRLYDLRLNEKHFSEGDLVFVRDSTRTKGKSPKLQPSWKGPYVVMKRLGPVLYEVHDHKVSKVLHHDRLKPCLMQDVPYWLSRKRKDLVTSCDAVVADAREEMDNSKSVEPHRDETEDGDLVFQVCGDASEPQWHDTSTTCPASSNTLNDLPQNIDFDRAPYTYTRRGRRTKPPDKLNL